MGWEVAGGGSGGKGHLYITVDSHCGKQDDIVN